MATKYWVGRAAVVTQVSAAQITAYDAATTYTITVGVSPFTVAISAPGTTSAAGTAAALVAAWNASTHPYCSGITAAVVTTDYVQLTADTSGVPFTVASSVASGTGTFAAFSATTAPNGPNFADTAINWSDASVPGNGDTVIFRDSSINCCWNLEALTATGLLLHVEQSYTGRIGLPWQAFATTANGETVDSTVPEYRPQYLKLDCASIDIGEHFGPGAPTGSTRIKIDNDRGSGGSTTTVYNTASSSADTAKPAVRLKYADSAADVYVRYAPGGVGIAADVPGETSTVDDVFLTDASGASRLRIGSGVTMGDYVQQGGVAVLSAAATVPVVRLLGGQLTTEGDYTITTATVEGGTWIANHVKTAGNAVTTANLSGGTTNARGTLAARTWATVNLTAPATLIGDDDYLTITTLNEPDGPYTLTVG